RREALGDDQRVRDAEQRIEQTRAAGVGIFLDPEDARETALRGAANLERVEAEADARIRNVLAQVLLGPRKQHRTGLPVVEGRKKLERLRIDAGLGLVGAEHANAIGLQRRSQSGGRGIEVERFGARQRSFGLRAKLAE